VPKGRQALLIDDVRARIVPTQVAGLDQRSLYIVCVDLVQHAFNQPFDRVLGGTVRRRPRHAERATRGAEYQIAPVPTLAEVRQRELYHVQRPHEIRLELVPDLVRVLVFPRPDDAVARTVGDNVDTAPVADRGVKDRFHRTADPHVAEEAQAVGRVPLSHRRQAVFKRATDRRDFVAVGERRFSNGAAHVACGPEDLLHRQRRAASGFLGKFFFPYHPYQWLRRILWPWRICRGREL
jgi:hypothetical protein